MIFRLIIGSYLIGCVCALIDLSKDLDEASNYEVGFWFSSIYILSRKTSYKYILQSWYFLHR